jgi:hypothetical protein
MVSDKYEHIDDILGDGQTRFFASGYRRVEADFEDIWLFPEALLGLKAILNVRYPADWSKKQQSVELQPHLSSIDAFVIAARLNELYLTAYFGLDNTMQTSAWIKAFSIRTLGKPQVSLDKLPVYLRHLTTTLDTGTVCKHVTTTRCEIGMLQVECEIEHGAHRLCLDAQGRFDGPALNKDNYHYYQCGYKQYDRRIESVSLDVMRKQATAVVRVHELCPPESGCVVGLGSAYIPSLTFVDGILVAAQLAQALLYKVDKLKRAETNNLWMRRISASCRTPFLPTNAFMAVINVRDTRTVQRGDAVWRIADIEANIQGIKGIYSVAHALPSRSDVDRSSLVDAMPGI